ncbi:hypothetical protein A5320_18220 [Rheinheimera sp. SA_1]|uniref:efflux RND transporter periplasmic adaptor subunit n=1 Tax=Rheinheimera sp. SA_1 TaxID=1827365 RepID=UPI0008001233|nr:efflux RND transporter periplasmic adaptor subunit [Rheinheimera sp. SA_1]OBP13485.1 hypothetical protein A5320_18220 [Rheinheimera sp. SA_1]
MVLSKLRLLAAMLLSSLILFGCKQEAAQPGVEFKAPVTVADVKLQTIEEHVIATGTVRAVEIIRLTVLNGGLLHIAKGPHGRYAEGDNVAAGEVIANITGEEIRIALKRQLAEQKLQEAKVKLDAIRALFAEELSSATTLEQTKSEYETVKLELETSIFRENRSKISSPIDGVILRLGRDQGLPMANGQLVEPGQLIAEVASLDTVVADVDLVGKDIARVSPGFSVNVKYYAWKNQNFQGTVQRLHPTIDQQSRALKAEIAVKNPDHLLKPGMFVEVAIVANRRENVPVVPQQAVTRRGGREVVFVLNGQRVEQRYVELGLRSDNMVEVTRGVGNGEQVVVLGLETLTDKMPVRISVNRTRLL